MCVCRSSVPDLINPGCLGESTHPSVLVLCVEAHLKSEPEMPLELCCLQRTEFNFMAEADDLKVHLFATIRVYVVEVVGQ